MIRIAYYDLILLNIMRDNIILYDLIWEYDVQYESQDATLSGKM